MTAQTYGAAEELAVWAATLADATLAATRAFVHGVRHDGALTLELLAEALQIGQVGLVTKAEGLLLVGARAVPCAR
jgi:hypothetical protein